MEKRQRVLGSTCKLLRCFLMDPTRVAGSPEPVSAPHTNQSSKGPSLSHCHSLMEKPPRLQPWHPGSVITSPRSSPTKLSVQRSADRSTSPAVSIRSPFSTSLNDQVLSLTGTVRRACKPSSTGHTILRSQGLHSIRSASPDPRKSSTELSLANEPALEPSCSPDLELSPGPTNELPRRLRNPELSRAATEQLSPGQWSAARHVGGCSSIYFSSPPPPSPTSWDTTPAWPLRNSSAHAEYYRSPERLAKHTLSPKANVPSKSRRALLRTTTGEFSLHGRRRSSLQGWTDEPSNVEPRVGSMLPQLHGTSAIGKRSGHVSQD